MTLMSLTKMTSYTNHPNVEKMSPRRTPKTNFGRSQRRSTRRGEDEDAQTENQAIIKMRHTSRIGTTNNNTRTDHQREVRPACPASVDAAKLPPLPWRPADNCRAESLASRREALSTALARCKRQSSSRFSSATARREEKTACKWSSRWATVCACLSPLIHWFARTSGCWQTSTYVARKWTQSDWRATTKRCKWPTQISIKRVLGDNRARPM